MIHKSGEDDFKTLYKEALGSKPGKGFDYCYSIYKGCGVTSYVITARLKIFHETVTK